MLKNLGDWLNDRTGYRDILHVALDEPVRGGARWSYVFGSALVVLLLVQMVTGVALGAYYSPSTTDAWASVNYIQTQVYLGWLLRGMHHFGASAMVIVVVLHMLQTMWFGAFRAPREMNWLAGVCLLGVVLGFALTGYLLPWDQKGYWATQVATSIIGTVPVLGGSLQALVQGGTSYGNLTLTRFYSLHVFVLPALVIGFTTVHVYLFRRHGVTPPPELSAQRAKELTEPFFPRQLMMDSIVAFVLVAGTAFFAWKEHGAPLAAPADPSSQYLARPEWYFLPLFQLLKYFEGSWQLVGTVVLPGLAVGFLVAVPFIHTALRRKSPGIHARLATLFTLGLLAVAGMGVLAVRADSHNPAFAKMDEEARKSAELAQRLALTGVPAKGPLFLYENNPVVHGRRIFQAHCASCHQPCDKKPYKGDPCLAGYASRDWLSRLIREPRNPHFFGNSSIDQMDAYTGPEQSLNAIVEFIYAQAARTDVNASLAAQGEKLFDSEGCATCHGLDGKGTDEAPDLKGYGTVEWLSAFVRNPAAKRFYGDKNQMDRFGLEKLTDVELLAVSAYLRAHGEQTLEYP